VRCAGGESLRWLITCVKEGFCLALLLVELEFKRVVEFPEFADNLFELRFGFLVCGWRGGGGGGRAGCGSLLVDAAGAVVFGFIAEK
jgi:hypothetical protein